MRTFNKVALVPLYLLSCGITSGCYVDIGEKLLTIACAYDGETLPIATIRIPLQRTLTQCMHKILVESGFTDIKISDVNQIKEVRSLRNLTLDIDIYILKFGV